MPRTITYYYTLLSPWTYLGFDAFHTIAEKHNLVVDYRPMRLGIVFAATGGQPLSQRPPARQAYRLIELQRWRDARNIPLNLKPTFWPTDAALADKLVIVMAKKALNPQKFLGAAHRAIWAEEKDVSKPETLLELLAPYPDAAKLLSEAASEDSEAIYTANSSEAAIQSGVFGAPSYVLDGEIFWGQDRLDMLETALASGRSAYQLPV